MSSKYLHEPAPFSDAYFPEKEQKELLSPKEHEENEGEEPEVFEKTPSFLERLKTFFPSRPAQTQKVAPLPPNYGFEVNLDAADFYCEVFLNGEIAKIGPKPTGKKENLFFSHFVAGKPFVQCLNLEDSTELNTKMHSTMISSMIVRVKKGKETMDMAGVERSDREQNGSKNDDDNDDDVFHDGEGPRIKIRSSSINFSQEEVFSLTAGFYQWFLLTFVPLTTKNILVTIQDVTEEENKRTTEKYEKAMSAQKNNRREFIGFLSHELRGSLNGIKLGLNELALRTQGHLDHHDASSEGVSEEMKEFGDASSELLSEMMPEVTSIESMLENVLKIELIATAEGDLHPIWFKCSNLVRNIDLSFRSRFRSKRLALDVHADSDLENVSFFGDFHKITQMCHKILDNAFRFSPQESCVRVYLSVTHRSKNGRWVLNISVADEGEGIEEEKCSTLIKPYKKLRLGQELDAGRQSLSLTYCSAVASAHKGKLIIDSQVGEGTTINVLLPLPVKHEQPMNFKSKNKSLTFIQEEEEEEEEEEEITSSSSSSVIEGTKQVLMASDKLSQYKQDSLSPGDSEAEENMSSPFYLSLMSGTLHETSPFPTDVSKLRVLIVDDSNITRRGVLRTLKRLKYEHIDIAEDGMQALKKVAEMKEKSDVMSSPSSPLPQKEEETEAKEGSNEDEVEPSSARSFSETIHSPGSERDSRVKRSESDQFSMTPSSIAPSEHIFKGYYHLILLDKEMPMMDGYETAEKLNALNMPSAIVGLTANAMDHQVEEFMNKGLSFLMTKPLSYDQVREMEEQVFKIHRPDFWEVFHQRLNKISRLYQEGVSGERLHTLVHTEST